MTLDIDELEALAKAATPGPWDVGVIHNEGEYGTGEDSYSGFKSYVVGCGPVDNWKSIVDTSNSDVAMIEVDGDYDSTDTWDEVGKCNASFIAAAREAVPALIARVRELEAALVEAWFRQYVQEGMKVEQARLHANARMNTVKTARTALEQKP
jgi:hypothetical protein